MIFLIWIMALWMYESWLKKQPQCVSMLSPLLKKPIERLCQLHPIVFQKISWFPNHSGFCLRWHQKTISLPYRFRLVISSNVKIVWKKLDSANPNALHAHSSLKWENHHLMSQSYGGCLRNPNHQLIGGKHPTNPLFCLGFNHPFGDAGFRNHPQYDYLHLSHEKYPNLYVHPMKYISWLIGLIGLIGIRVIMGQFLKTPINQLEKHNSQVLTNQQSKNWMMVK